MNKVPTDYSLFYKFIETFSPTGFKDIDRKHPVMLELEELLHKRNQFFFVADLMQSHVIFTSTGSLDIVGVDAEELTPFQMIEALHPDEMYRNTKGWAKLLSLAGDLMKNKTERPIVSVNMKMRNPKGGFSEILYQCYLFYSEGYRNTVYDIQIHSNIDHLPKRKSGYHYYTGNDLSNFRYPDKELMELGNPLSERENQILELISKCKNSDEIADEICISVHTVNTHRRNIIEKMGKESISEVIYEFKDQGIL